MFWELFANKLIRIYSLKLKKLEPIVWFLYTAWNIFLDPSLLKTNVKQLSMTLQFLFMPGGFLIIMQHTVVDRN